jgi:hypothetical protein
MLVALVLTRFASVSGMGKKEQRRAIWESRKCGAIRDHRFLSLGSLRRKEALVDEGSRD